MIIYRLLDDDNGGTIGFPEFQKAIDLANTKVDKKLHRSILNHIKTFDLSV